MLSNADRDFKNAHTSKKVKTTKEKETDIIKHEKYRHHQFQLRMEPILTIKRDEARYIVRKRQEKDEITPILIRLEVLKLVRAESV